MFTDVIIIGAGAAGLSAASTLVKAGKSVIILEARDRVGGRVHTIKDGGFTGPTETGAEFVHGSATHTYTISERAGLKYVTTESNSWEVIDGNLQLSEVVNSDINEVSKALNQLKDDITMGDFLEQNFSGPSNEGLRQSITGMVQGFDAADVEKISALSLKEEWSSEDEFTGNRPVGGYSTLINFLKDEAIAGGAQLVLSSPVTDIHWNRHDVKISCSNNESYTAAKVLVTVPAAVLKHGSIKFTPALLPHQDAFQKIETGGVIKFLFEFKEAFWENENSESRTMNNMGFIFSDAFVPTWWSQKPSDSPLLTGWLAGPSARAHKDDPNLLAKAFESLKYIFACSEEFLKEQLVTYKIVNWLNDPFALGAYGYRTLHTNAVLSVINVPVEETIYFAGEAFNDGKDVGTVEAALNSADQTVRKILAVA